MKTQRIAVAMVVCGAAFMAGCPFGADPLVGIGDPAAPGTPVTPGTPGTPGTSIPKELVGKWQSILAYVPANYQGLLPIRDFIGSYGIFYYFTADGQYQVDLRALANYYDFACYANDHRREWGTVEIAGVDYTFRPTHAFESNFDSCGESEYLDPAPTQVQTVKLMREVDAAGWPYLRLIFPDGEELLLEKCRDCE
jgi:hypothetical protein